MELHQLECFVRAAELGNFTKADKMLYISQPALSKNIALLEKNLGVQLFERRGKRFTLSPIGSQVLEHAQHILDHSQQIQLLCRSEQSRQAPVTLRMMCASDLFSDIMAGFKPLHPDIQVALLHNGRIPEEDDSDIRIFSTRQPLHYETERSVLREELRMVVPPGHPLYDREYVNMEEIAKYSVLSLRLDTELRYTEDFYYKLAGVTPHRDVECDHPAILQKLLKTGFGMAMVPTHTWDVTEGTQNRMLPIRDFLCVRYINVHLLHPMQSDRSVQAFFDYLVGFFSEMDMHS